MVGRGAEQAALSAVYAHARGGRPHVALITGAAGIGKTRLVEELMARARLAPGGGQVRIGESAPLAGATLAYGPFLAALGSQAGWLLADDSAGDMLAARHRTFLRVLELLADLAAASPLLLVLEDLHWADESSRELLAFLATRLRDEPVMIAGTMREEELAAGTRLWLAELERRTAVTRLRLGRLADAEVAQLVAGLMPAETGADELTAVVTVAAGNPLYAKEVAMAGTAVLPASISDAVLARAARLMAAAQAVVRQVCVADGGMSHDLVAATVELPEEQLLASARQAVDSGLLISTGDGYAFGHELIRQVIYAQLLPGERQRLHRRLATALAARVAGSGPMQGNLAQHWHLAGCPGHAAAAAVTAAREAVQARAYPEALRCYALALELADWLPESGPGLLEEAAQTASWAGDPDRAAEWAALALAQSGAAAAADRARLLERLGRYRWEAGDLPAATDATGQAIVLLADDPPSALQARVLAAHATARMLAGDLDAALPLAERAVTAARRADALAEQAHGLATLGIVQAQRGALDTGLAALDTSFCLARQAGSVEGVVRAAANHMYLLCTAGRFTEALAVAHDGRQAAVALDTPTALSSVLDNNTVAVLIATGRWAQADRLLSELAGQSSGNATRYLQLQQLELAVGRGDDERASDLAAALRKSAEDPRIAGPMHACAAEQALNAGDLAAAAQEVLDGLAALADAALPAEEIRLLSAAARIAADIALLPPPVRPPELAEHWEQSAASVGDRALAITRTPSGEHSEVAAFGVLVAAEQAREHGTDRRATWRAVADAWQQAGQPYREAYARLREAEAAVRAGRRDQAARALGACAELAGPLQAAPLLALADDLARRARLTVRPAAQRSAAAGARFDLTDRERDVLDLLASGDSNRQIARALFISDRTVAVHVSRILDKLGVRNRTQAAAIGARLNVPGPLPPPADT
ncbi:MAG: AAA family ATPase [Streptosporangiaceae bacterium]|jgi:DNA-binding CsgD family transcriptional regulator/tetratricopeptide (TPR) repeat protein